MKLAFYTYSYTDRLNMPIIAALEQIAATGYDGIDISGTHGNSADPRSVTTQIRQETRSAATRLGLSVEAIITHATLTDSLFTEAPLDLRGSVDLAVDVGAPVVVFHMGGSVDDAAKRAETWKRVVDYLKRALDYAAARQVKLAVDGVWKGWIVETPEAFLELSQAVNHPSFGINFDPCYLTLLGFDPVQVAQMWRGHIVHGHLKDHIGGQPEWEHKIPGQGEIDYARVVEGLHDIGFDAAISIETFTTMDFEEACLVGYKTLAPYI